MPSIYSKIRKNCQIQTDKPLTNQDQPKKNNLFQSIPGDKYNKTF